MRYLHLVVVLAWGGVSEYSEVFVKVESFGTRKLGKGLKMPLYADKQGCIRGSMTILENELLNSPLKTTSPRHSLRIPPRIHKYHNSTTFFSFLFKQIPKI
jgi:hypothetical protein